MDFALRASTDAYTLTLLLSLGAMLIWESVAPFRALTATRNARWRLNFLMMLVGVSALALLVPLSLAGVARWAQARGWGLFNQWALAGWAALASSMALMDLAKYWEHRAMHQLTWLWRIHRAHHWDPEMDVTTSVRFHPFELAFTLAADMLVVALIGAPPEAVLLYRLIRVVVSSLAHGNIDLSMPALVATPNFHRVHHSIAAHEQARNLSGGLTLWDRLFGTYLGAPAGDARTMPLGISHPPPSQSQSLGAMLRDPFRPA